MTEESQSRSAQWESRWRERSAPEFVWDLTEPPIQLRNLIDGGEVPMGVALDLGCGSGIATAYLARAFKPMTVGLDIALAAVRQARALAQKEDSHAAFLVAEAPFLPIRSESLALIFDRGCLQGIPREHWSSYFIEADRVLMPDGFLQLMISKAPGPSSRLSRVRRRARRLLRGRLGNPARQAGGPSFLSDKLLTQLPPRSMKLVLLEHFTFTTKAGRVREFTHAIFRKSQFSTWEQTNGASDITWA